MTNLFFDEDGAFKAGTELNATDSSYQVELPTGKRIKVKKSHVFVTFSSPSPAEFMSQAQALSEEMDLDLLWEFAPDAEFGVAQIAADYFGQAPTPLQFAAAIMRLHANPVYFYRKGRGNYRRAPAETLKLALAAIEKRRQQDLLKDGYVREFLEENRTPAVIAEHAIELLVHPDKNGIEWKALKEASDSLGTSPLRLLLKTGGITNPWKWHVESFFTANFPKGTEFPRTLPAPEENAHTELAFSDVRAFSIDDSNTTEVDDAVSVSAMSDNRTRVGIHISAPALGIMRDGPMDLTVRERMSTVYAPGLKTTMLPESYIKAYSLDEGRTCPVVSLYVVVDNETFEILSSESRLERIEIAKNLWYDKIEHLVTEQTIAEGNVDVPFGPEIIWLWNFAKKLQKKREEVRGRPEPVGRIDWSIDVIGDPEHGEIKIKGRRRGAPLDLLVAEMMILANSTWGAFLDEKHTAGIYRSQRMGKVKMTTVPGPHDGIGVEYYSWATSPLRRYIDLVNQRQLISVLRGEVPGYRENDSDLFSIISAFDSVYTTYLDFQTRMERYWSMRWIEQEKLSEVRATVAKGDLVRIDGMPMEQRVPGLPELPRGQSVVLEVLDLDFIDLVMECRLKTVLEENHSENLEEEQEAQKDGAEMSEAQPAEASPANPE
jgi:exoribonuclease-2